jgi:hypothetical protein
MKNLKALLVFACLILAVGTARASRLQYTFEMAKHSEVIGRWGPHELTQNENGFRLGQALELFEGDPSLLTKAKTYSPRLQTALTRIVTSRQAEVLFLHLDGEYLDLPGDLATLQSNGLTEKVVKNLLEQISLLDNWNNLPIKEQIERSDLIVTGKIISNKSWSLQSYYVPAERVYRGISPEKLEILPVPDSLLDSERLLLLKRNWGTGPDYLLMHSIPLQDAEEYLRILANKN